MRNIIAIAILLIFLTSCGTLNLSSGTSVPVAWQIAGDAAPKELMDTVRQELDPSWRGSLGRMSFTKIEDREKYALYLVNPKIIPPPGLAANDPTLTPLCGVEGCRYLGYVKAGNGFTKVFDSYLHDRLPQGAPFIRADADAPFPTLNVTEFLPPLTQAHPLSVSRFSYDGSKYQRIETYYEVTP